MKHIKNNLIFLINIIILFYACKTTEVKENSSLNVRNDKEVDGKLLWENGLDLTNANLDSLYELYKDKYTLGDWEEAKYKGMRWTGSGFIRIYEEGEYVLKAGDMLQYDNSIVIYPNPTSSSVRVDIIKNITIIDGDTGMEIPFRMDLSWCFPFDLTMKLILDEKIIWTYRNPSCNGTEIIDESILQKAGNYQLVVEVDGFTASKNFMVVKKQ